MDVADILSDIKMGLAKKMPNKEKAPVNGKPVSCIPHPPTYLTINASHV